MFPCSLTLLVKNAEHLRVAMIQRRNSCQTNNRDAFPTEAPLSSECPKVYIPGKDMLLDL